jgi:hypothetical protein
MGSSRYDDSESITFIFSRHEVLRRICQESAVTAERSARSRIDNQRKMSGSFLLQLHGAGPKGGASFVACKYPSIDNESKLHFYITWNYVRVELPILYQ